MARHGICEYFIQMAVHTGAHISHRVPLKNLQGSMVSKLLQVVQQDLSWGQDSLPDSALPIT